MCSSLSQPTLYLRELQYVFGIDVGVLTTIQTERAGECINEEIEELVFVDIIVYSLNVGHVLSKQIFPLTGFVRY